MSTPDPAISPPPPPPNNAKKWLIGCAIALVVAVLLVIGAAVAIIYAAKRQVDAVSSDAKQLAEDARSAAAMLAPTKAVAQGVAQLAEARMRLGRAASAVAWMAQQGSVPAGPCPAELAQAALPVDAEWFVELAKGLPDAATGTPWMRDPSIFQAVAGKDEAQALIALDGALADAGAVAVIQARGDGKADARRFDGYVQLVGYPDGETVCTVGFKAEGATGGEFQSSFWAAEGTALGK